MNYRESLVLLPVPEPVSASLSVPAGVAASNALTFTCKKLERKVNRHSDSSPARLPSTSPSTVSFLVFSSLTKSSASSPRKMEKYRLKETLRSRYAALRFELEKLCEEVRHCSQKEQAI